jgi:hypothetical protein
MCFLVDKIKAWSLLLLSTIAIIMFNGANGLFACFLFWCIYLYSITKRKVVFAAPIISFIALLFLFPSALSGSGRFEQWRDAIPYMLNNHDTLFGSGVGTFQFLYPVHQILEGVNQRGYFTFLHSDVIQLLIECGIVGVVLCSMVVFNVAFKRSFFTTSVIAVYIGNSIFNFPFRMSSDVMVLAFYLGIIYSNSFDISRKKDL